MCDVDTTTRPFLTALLLAGLCLGAAGPAYGQALPGQARDSLAAVVEAAQMLDPAAQLVAVSASDVSPDFGFAGSWLYLFIAPGTDTPILVIRQNDQIAAAHAGFGSNVFLNRVLLPGFTPAPLPAEWIDSDEAIAAAERNGGTAFRTARTRTEVSALLVSLPEAFMPEGTVVDTTQAFWIVTYASAEAGEYRVFVVDAATGNALSLTPATAMANLGRATQAAVNFAADAALVAVTTVLPDVNRDGRALLWSFTYYSASQDAFRRFVVTGGVLVASGAPDDDPPVQPLPARWIDSDVAAAAADTSAQGLRADTVGVFVQAELRRGLFPGDAARAVWAFTYAPVSEDTTATVRVDAQSGLPVRVGVDAAAAVPARFVLSQNYPNPFNPETVIRYDVSQAGPMRLVVYDGLGRVVRVLADGERPAGTFEVRWDGTDRAGTPVPSGVYFYRLSSEGAARTRSMTLVR